MSPTQPHFFFQMPTIYKRKRTTYPGSDAGAIIRRYGTGRGSNVKLIPSRYAKASQYVELKFHDNSFTDVGVAAGSIAPFVNIANGTGPSDRIGNHVGLKDLVLDWIVRDTGGGSYTHHGRIIILQDMQTNKATPAVLDVLNTATVNSQFNPSNRSRFKIIVDENYSVSTVTAVGTAWEKNTQKTNLFRSLRGKKITYSGTTSAITDIDSGALLYVHLSDTASKVTVAFTTRCQFYD